MHVGNQGGQAGLEACVSDLEWFGFIQKQPLNLTFGWVWSTLSAEPLEQFPTGFIWVWIFPGALGSCSSSCGSRATKMDDLRWVETRDLKGEGTLAK